jgi:hypothetical protein
MILKVEDLKGRKATDYTHMRGSGFSLISHGVEGEPRLTVLKCFNKKERTTTVTWAVDGQHVVDLRAALAVINGERRLEDVLKPEEPKKWGIRALSIRQPWVWAIFNLGKDVENREWKDNNPNLPFRGDFLIHISASKSKKDRVAYDTLRARGFDLPPFERMDRGGIVGAATLVDIVTDHPTAWAAPGQKHLVLENVRPCPFIPCTGRLGFFKPPLEVISALPRTKKPVETYLQAG